MQLLSQSAFLQALGYAIAGSLWQAALLWLVAAGINGIFKLSAQAKYKVALLAQFGAFVWFLVSLQFYYVQCGAAIAAVKHAGLNTDNSYLLQPGGHSFSSLVLSFILKTEKFLPYLSLAYICLLAVLAVRWINGYRQTTIIKTQGLQKIDVEWRLFVKKIAGLLNIKHPVSIYVSELVKSPLTIGFLKPLILIPLASLNNLTTYQLEAVILHELAHIKRADYLINIVQSIIEISLFFNPFIQLLGKITKRERENSCDDWVLQFQYDASTYAEALLRIAYMQQAPAFAMNAADNKDNDLLWRVKRMLNQKQKSFQYRNRLLALLLITGLLSSVAWLTPVAKQQDAVAAATPAKPVVAEPLSIKIDNPLFNPVFFLNKPFKAEVSKAEEDARLGLEQASKITNTVLANVVPAAMNKVEAINIDLPSISTKYPAVGNMLQSWGIKQDFDNAMKIANDSIKTAIKNASAQVKAIDWSPVDKGLSEASTEVAKQFATNKELAGLNKLGLGNLIVKTLGSIKLSSNTKVETNNADDNDEDNGATITIDGATIKAQTNKLTREQQRQEQRRKLDSIKKEYSYNFYKAQSRITAGDLANDVNVEYHDNADYATAINYTPVNYIQTASNAPKASWNGKDGDIAVSIAEGSTLVAVKEDNGDENSYKKRLTIETLDKKGKRHTFHVVVEVYQ